jgi:hypothetical protein
MTMAFAHPDQTASSPHALARPSEGSKLYESWASHREPREAARRATEREYRLVSGVAYAVFLPVAAAARLMPAHLRIRLCGTACGRSVLGDARAMAESSISIAFTA